MDVSNTIVERSIYKSLLDTLLKLGYTLDPANYFPASLENLEKFFNDKADIEGSKGKFIYLFGSSNYLSRGKKNTPRIVINSEGFIPGDIGFGNQLIEESDNGYILSNEPFESIDQLIDITITASDIESFRKLSYVLSKSIPNRGYIKPYTYDSPPYSGNIFITLDNFFDEPDLQNGLLQKTYKYTVKDSLVNVSEPVDTIPKLIDITLLQQSYAELFTAKPALLKTATYKTFASEYTVSSTNIQK